MTNITLELSNLRIDCGFTECNTIEDHIIVENITHKGREYVLVEDTYGYTIKTAFNLIRKHCKEVRNKRILITRGPSPGLYSTWGLYVSTGRLLTGVTD